MLEILQYIFSSVWILLGFIILVYAIGEIICNVVANVYRSILRSKSIYNMDNNIKIKQEGKDE
jgi:hypothetical protein